jgi:hypothetical protein
MRLMFHTAAGPPTDGCCRTVAGSTLTGLTSSTPHAFAEADQPRDVAGLVSGCPCGASRRLRLRNSDATVSLPPLAHAISSA